MKTSASMLLNSISNLGLGSAQSVPMIAAPSMQQVVAQIQPPPINTNQPNPQPSQVVDATASLATGTTAKTQASGQETGDMRTSASALNYRNSANNNYNQNHNSRLNYQQSKADSNYRYANGLPESEESSPALSPSMGGGYASMMNSNENEPEDNEDGNDGPRNQAADLRESPSGGSASGAGEYEAAPDEAAARREQEAAEASEAEAANKEALNEQQQAQREIIMQQAQSEARAIKQQQEALMMQQKLQQQMLMRRNQELVNPPREDSRQRHSQQSGSGYSNARGHRQQVANKRAGGSGNNIKSNYPSDPMSMRYNVGGGGQNSHNNQGVYNSNNDNDDDDGSYQPNPSAGRYRQSGASNLLSMTGSAKSSRKVQSPQQSSLNERIQFSDQLAGYSDPNGNSNYENDQEEKSNNHRVNPSSLQSIGDTGDNAADGYGQMGESSIRRSSVSPIEQPDEVSRKLNLTTTGGDLLPAAQHFYGTHYGSLGGYGGDGGYVGHGGHGHGHKGGYYQFAESHKKGQYDSGFRRGGKKFSISGKASQHKSHANGHVKWQGIKGKGSHKWDLKHKGKKDHGYGHGYGFGFGYGHGYGHGI